MRLRQLHAVAAVHPRSPNPNPSGRTLICGRNGHREDDHAARESSAAEAMASSEEDSGLGGADSHLQWPWRGRGVCEKPAVQDGDPARASSHFQLRDRERAAIGAQDPQAEAHRSGAGQVVSIPAPEFGSPVPGSDRRKAVPAAAEIEASGQRTPEERPGKTSHIQSHQEEIEFLFLGFLKIRVLGSIAMAMVATATAIARKCGWQLQQARGVYIDCKGLNFEQAMARYGRKMRQDRTLNDLLKKEYYVKPSDVRRLAEKERVKREKKRVFREKLKFVLMLRARGL